MGFPLAPSDGAPGASGERQRIERVRGRTSWPESGAQGWAPAHLPVLLLHVPGCAWNASVACGKPRDQLDE